MRQNPPGYTGTVTPEELSSAVSACLQDAVTAGELTVADGVDLPQARVERPKNREHGDWATTVAMQVAKKVGRPRGTSPRSSRSTCAGYPV